MSRSAYIRMHPRRVLAALATFLLAAAVAVGSGATFTASSANPANTFSAGTLSIQSSLSGAIVSLSNMRPGDSQSGTIDITNSGSLSGPFTLAESNVVNKDSTGAVVTTGSLLASQLQLAIVDCGSSTAPSCATGTSVYSGAFGSLPSSSLGTFAAGSGHRYQFTVTLPSSTGNGFQGTSASADFNWSATS